MATDFERVAAVISQILGVDTRYINPATDIDRDLGADSLDRMELVYELEEEFCLRIPDYAARNMHTVNETLQLVEQIRKT